MPLDLIEFPADDLGRAQAFWEGVLGVSLAARLPGEGEGIQTQDVAELLASALVSPVLPGRSLPVIQ